MAEANVFVLGDKGRIVGICILRHVHWVLGFKVDASCTVCSIRVRRTPDKPMESHSTKVLLQNPNYCQNGCSSSAIDVQFPNHGSRGHGTR